jgi:hypothetical protein
LASANTASFVLYNLNETTRKKIFKDPYDISDRRGIELLAGYDTQTASMAISPAALFNRAMPLCFRGEIRQAYSVRRGCDMRTEIECFDGGAALSQSFSSQTAAAGTSMQGLIKSLAKDLIGVTKTTIGNIDNPRSTRSTALFGNTAELMKEATGGQFYIDNQEGFALGQNDVVEGELNEISSKTGLLETPRRAGTMIECTMLFEPRIRISQGITLNSSVEKNYNGTYKVVGVTHRGIISGAKNGPCITTVSLFSGIGPFSLVRGSGV